MARTARSRYVLQMSCRYRVKVGYLLTDLVCAVNYPQPIKEDLDAASNRPAYALHDCPDFELKPQPETRTIQFH